MQIYLNVVSCSRLTMFKTLTEQKWEAEKKE